MFTTLVAVLVALALGHVAPGAAARPTCALRASWTGYASLSHRQDRHSARS